MISLFFFCLLCSLAITAIHVLFTWPGMALFFISFKLEQLSFSYEGEGYDFHSFKKWWQEILWFILKPVFNCLTCMASLWGSIFYLLFYPKAHSISSWLFSVLIIAGINTLICAWLEKNTDGGC